MVTNSETLTELQNRVAKAQVCICRKVGLKKISGGHLDHFSVGGRISHNQ